MCRLEVLVATMNQTDFSKIEEMHITSDAFLANQSTGYSYEEANIDNHRVRMLTTPEKGVGKNRNKAILYSTGDILLFSDDDMVYNDGYEREILKAYQELPDADVIIFGCDFVENGVVYKKIRNKRKRLKKYTSMKYGACLVSIRKKSLEKANIWFSVLFGGGCMFSAGEDSLFLIDCFRKGLKVYSHEYVLGNCKTDSSTWFSGYHEKYYFDKGVWIRAAFPAITGYAFMIYLALRTGKMTDISMRKRIHCMKNGMNAWKSLEVYR